MSWDKYLKKYVWDDDKTPYLVRVANMNQVQAGYEILAYTIFLAILFAVISLASLSDDAPHGRSIGVSIYAISIVFGAVTFGATKDYIAILYCSTAPPAVLFYLVVYGFPPNLHLFDKILIVAFTLVLLRYAFRLVAIARTYPQMPRGTDNERGGPGGRDE